MEHLARAAEHYPDLPLAELDTSDLAPIDGTLAHAIDQAVRRRWMTLAAILGARLRQPFDDLEPSVRSALLVGAAQIVLLDRIPAHAAVDGSVRWAKRHVRPGAGGLVNAVLRRVAEMIDGAVVDTPAPDRAIDRRREIPLADGRSIRVRDALFPEEPAAQIAARTSHSEVTVRRWLDAAGTDVTLARTAHGILVPPVIVSAIGETSSDDRLIAHRQPGFAVFNGRRTALRELLADRPDARVQDPTAAAAVRATADLPVRLAVDWCAGRGTKTGQLASVHADARVVASDTDADRLDILRQTYATHSRISVSPADQVARDGDGADLILLDVPCSNSGVLARRLEARYRMSGRRQRELVGIQRAIANRAATVVRPGGWLLYTTCSLEPEENEAQVEWLQTALGLELLRQHRIEPAGRPGDPAAEYTDGGFHALLRRLPDSDRSASAD